MFPKVLILVTLVWGAAQAEAPTAQYLPPAANGGSNGYPASRGESTYAGNEGEGGYGATGVYREVEEGGQPEPFNFAYEVKDADSGNDYSHKADSDGNTVKGEYKVLLPDGRRQTVTYTADEQGYNADVQYEGEAVITAEADATRNEGTAPGYPSAGPTGSAVFSPTAGAPGTAFGTSGNGAGYPSGGPAAARQGSTNGFPRPTANYLPPGK